MPKRQYRKRMNKRGKSALKKQIRKVVRAMVPKPELKRQILTQGDQLVGNDLTITGIELNPAYQGVDQTNLELTGESPGTVLGLQYIAKFIAVRFQAYNADTSSSHVLRILVVRDDQPAGPTVQLYSPITNYNKLVFTSNQYDSFINYQKPSRFKVLFDKLYNLEENGGKSIVRTTRKINLHNTKVSNTLDLGTADTISPLNHRYLLFAISDTNEFVNWRFQTHFCFTDA